MKSDRIFGLVVVFGALAFFAGALQIRTSFLSDPVGPRVFPMIISVAALLSGLVMLWRPDAEPEWPSRNSLILMGVALVTLVAYAYSLRPMGFLVPTAVASGVISYLIQQHLMRSALVGVALSAGLFLIFKYALGLGLVALPRALLG